ncbi:DEAD/DEAH box helicase [Mycolicibacterium sp. lyk4-40-TYG-92]|uniref:DEAD/DEAH box helicase n=1 Tax=Mycolicibacterium sp. lyk4-40-TYG-92 TaxID=3040295 RepID=UPI00254A1928|nr:DEAD/DEAH box helicase [Mycolicibacterium sp. lyk4-40-TYG-92]
MIRRDGVLPADAPQFDDYLDDDLLNYGYALIATSLQLLDTTDAEPLGIDAAEAASRQQLAHNGFIQASYALEAATRNTEPTDGQAFHRLIAGAASHLGGYAARAFSLVQSSIKSGKLTPMEATLADIILRDLGRIETRTISLRTSPATTDDSLVDSLEGRHRERGSAAPGIDPLSEDGDLLDVLGPVGVLLTEHYHSAVAAALFGIAHEQPDLLQTALADLATGEQAALEVGVPGPWWVFRLTRRLLGDLGQTSIAANLPTTRPPAATADAGLPTQEPDWADLRGTFVATLLARGRSEIDLWPSQLHAVQRIFDSTCDLVVALPTSAGKTRIAELCILACLAQGRRAVYVTPLRALSAQTEQVLESTFTPLGVSVSSLYGAMGTSDFDEDALRTSQVVVATPEKLDFALRTDASVLDDVGLVILDEGHMIGREEREVRYEAQVQRLLRRADAHARRIVCLSAVFPSGDQLDDFVAWMTGDGPDGLHREDWRPTLQRFGLVEWRDDYARLTMTLGQDRPFIPRYIEAKTPPGRRQKLFPSDDRELVIATAWRLLEEGQSVLIFCPQRRSVEPYAKQILKLREQELIDSVLPDDVDLREVLAIGAEWFGPDHAILGCLKLGVAIHHGALPGPFRREVERLLRTGKLKVTVASPTLAQGLNLSASAVLFHGLSRGQDHLLSGAEFANVVGRAGRAFVDTEGLVLYPRFKRNDRNRRQWIALTSGQEGKTLESGLIAVSKDLINRLIAAYGTNKLQPAIDYLTGTPDWTLPVIVNEEVSTREDAAQRWRANLALLDTALLSILGDDDSDPDQVIQLVTDVLRDSLWERQLLRYQKQGAQTALREVVNARARHLWSTSTAAQRRGWYLAGVGADAGAELGAVSEAIVELTSRAEDALAADDSAEAAQHLLQIATIVFGLPQFRPETKLLWPPVLNHWLSGRALNELDDDTVDVAQFIESDLIYRLVWGMEASRVYELAQGNLLASTLTGTATMAIETGTLCRPASVLIRSGFDHRLAAIAAVRSTEATFDSAAGMRQWLESLTADLTGSPDWPTIDSHTAWREFANRTTQFSHKRWTRQMTRIDDVAWYGTVPAATSWLRVTDAGHGNILLWSTGFDPLGKASIAITPYSQGVLYARRTSDTHGVELYHHGPLNLPRN